MRQKRLYSLCRAALTAVAALAGIALPAQAYAQGSSVNAYSPYTMFGIGELGTMGNTAQRSMGGVGVAWRSGQMVSMLNPAGYSATFPKSFIFDVSAEGNFLQNRQRKYDAANAYQRTAKNAKNTINFHELAIQFPVAKGLGFGLSIAPYSSVGYNMSHTEPSEDIWGTIGRVMYTYTGDGDVTEVRAGAGWEPFKNFSIGIAAKYYWGNIKHNYASSVSNDYVGTGTPKSIVGVDDYSISNFKFQVGLQWSAIATDKRMLTFGATYDYGGSLRPKVEKSIYQNDSYYTEVVHEKKRSQMRLPHQVNVGVMYQDTKFTAGFDYERQMWGSNKGVFDETIYGKMKVGYVDTNTFKAGFEYTPNRFDVRRYLRRMAYRIGGRYSDYYQTYNGMKINQYAITAGIGFPLRFMGATSIDVGFEYGCRGTIGSITNAMGQRIGMIRQDYFKVSLGLSMFGEDYWFVRPKYD